MKKQISNEQWAKEFHDFMTGEPVKPPKVVTEQIFAHVMADLNPSAWLVFSKVALIHVIVGTLSLLFCPQFGLNLTGSMGLMSLLMRYGEHVCMLGCGAIFVAGTALVASLLLRPEEVRAIRRTELLQFGILGLLSMGAIFLCTGTNVIFSLALFWFLGAILGGLGSLELGWLIRRHLMNRKTVSHRL